MLTRGLMRFARALPRSAGLRLFSAMGGTAGYLLKEDRERAIDNLHIAFPEMSRPLRSAMTKAMFRALGRNAYEFLNLEGSTPERLGGLVDRVEGMEHLHRAVATGQGLIAITGHIGCFELMAAFWASQGYSVNVVARELWEKRLNRDLVRMRESVGYRTIDRDSGGKELLRILRGNGMVAILMDQHTRVDGIYVPFFNRPAHTPTGVAKLALRTGAIVLPMAIYMTHGGRHVIRILPMIEHPDTAMTEEQRVAALTERCSSAIEELIRLDPKQWVWFHRRWRDQEAGIQYAAAG